MRVASIRPIVEWWRTRLGVVLAPIGLAALVGSSAAAFDNPVPSPDSNVSPTAWAVSEVPSPAPAGSGMYSLAVGPDGRVRLIWIEPRGEGEGHALEFATLDGDAWSAPRTVASGADWFINWADHPSMTVLPDGSLAAHWLVANQTKQSSYGYGLRIARSSDGGATWHEVYQAGIDNVLDYSGFVSFLAGETELAAAYLAPSREAGADAARGESAEHIQVLRYVRLQLDGTVIADDVIDTDVCSCCPTATADTAEGPVVVYRDRAEDEIRDISIMRYRDGAWTGPVPVHRDGWQIPGCPTNGPTVSAIGRSLAVAWFTAAGDAPHVNVAFSRDAGARFASPIRIDGGRPVGWTGVELLDDGSAVVSWLEATRGGQGEVRLRRVWPDGRLGSPLTVAPTSAGRSTGVPQLVRSGDRLIVAWRTDRVRTAVVTPSDRETLDKE